MYKLLIGLILICIGLGLFSSYKISQQSCDVIEDKALQFVVGKTGKYCYVQPHVPKTLTIWGVFDTIGECEKHLSLRQ